MARYIFGADLAAVVWGTTSVSGVADVVVLGRSTTNILAYDAQTGGSQYTDLTDLGGSALTDGIITADSNGLIGFKGPDGIRELWLDAGIGSRVRVVTAEIASYVDTQDATKVGKTGGGAEGLYAHGTRTTTTDVNLANGNVQTLTLGGNITLTFSGSTASAGCSFLLIVTQDGTGSRVITWPAAVKWSNATAPTLSTAAAAVDVLTFVTVNNGTTWYGFLGGKGMA